MFRVYVSGYVSGYASGYVLERRALDERDVMRVRIEVCIKVSIGVCIGEVKHAPFHEFLSPIDGKTQIVINKKPYIATPTHIGTIVPFEL